MQTDSKFNTLTCRACGCEEMFTRTPMPFIDEHFQTVLRTKECRSCGASYQTAEIDISIARDVLEEDADG